MTSYTFVQKLKRTRMLVKLKIKDVPHRYNEEQWYKKGAKYLTANGGTHEYIYR